MSEIPAETPKNFLQWKVKPIWKLLIPSSTIGSVVDTIPIYGVDRGSLDISHNWVKINSVEQHNQGFADTPTDFRITIAVKEQGRGFESMRRLSAGGKLFDIQCDLLRQGTPSVDVGNLPNEYGITLSTYIPWMDGFEMYIGCIVQREGQTIDIGAFPIREFEVEFLERKILPTSSNQYNTQDIKHGNGVFNSLSDLGIGI